ncbi:MAG: peptide-binding protein, partial [Marinobacter sp. 34-60-7]
MTPIRLVFCLLLVASSLSVAQARTVWVDDQLYLPVRSGAGTQFRIIENAVPSGTPLEVLEAGESYTRVRTPKGTEGWVSTQYLSNEPIAADQLRRVSAELESARSELAQIREQLSSVTEERNTLENAENTLS